MLNPFFLWILKFMVSGWSVFGFSVSLPFVLCHFFSYVTSRFGEWYNVWVLLLKSLFFFLPQALFRLSDPLSFLTAGFRQKGVGGGHSNICKHKQSFCHEMGKRTSQLFHETRIHNLPWHSGVLQMVTSNHQVNTLAQSSWSAMPQRSTNSVCVLYVNCWWLRYEGVRRRSSHYLIFLKCHQMLAASSCFENFE